MKKIGIMSMQRIINYGSFLQAYGLKKILEELDYNVEFVDYEYEKPIIESKNKSTGLASKLKSNRKLINRIKSKIQWIIYNKKYSSYLKKYLNVQSSKNIRPNDIDYLIIGSDEVFNCMQGYPVGFSRELFGNHYDDVSVLSYAASFGFTTLDLINKYGIKDELSCLLKKFCAISVRDKNSYEIISNLLKYSPEEHLDPVLVSSYNYSSKIRLKNYIIIYAYPGRLSQEEESYIKSFAKKHNKKIVSLGFNQDIADYNLYVDPMKVLSYFKNADYVITDTFHGTVFSIKSNTKFCTIIRDSNRNKLQDLLNKMDKKDRAVHKLQDIESKYLEDCDFSNTNKILEKEREKSINYLKNNLQKN